MARRLNATLGYYVPAFFEMHVDTNSPDLTLSQLKNTDATVLFHEYIHFLQDISSCYGLGNLYCYSEAFKEVSSIVNLSNNKELTVPVAYDNGHNVELNNLIQTETIGSRDEIDRFEISDIDIFDIDMIEGSELEQIKGVLVTCEDGNVFQFGALAIMESMAYILERLCSPSGYVSSPEFPYSSAEKVAAYYSNTFAENLLLVLALCDMSLQSSNPGMVFYNFMVGIHKGDLSFSTPEEIYDYFYSIDMFSANLGRSSFLHQFNVLIDKVGDILKSYMIIPGFDTTYHKWIDCIVDFAKDWRNIDRYYLINMARIPDLLKNGALGKAFKEIGSPVMVNNMNDYFIIPPDVLNKGSLGIGLEIFMALNQIDDLFKSGIKKCRLIKFCNKSFPGTVDSNCLASPWNRSSYPQLCLFCIFWKHWGFADRINKIIINS